MQDIKCTHCGTYKIKKDLLGNSLEKQNCLKYLDLDPIWKQSEQHSFFNKFITDLEVNFNNRITLFPKYFFFIEGQVRYKEINCG